VKSLVRRRFLESSSENNAVSPNTTPPATIEPSNKLKNSKSFSIKSAILILLWESNSSSFSKKYSSFRALI
jgi:hypothetical protein